MLFSSRVIKKGKNNLINIGKHTHIRKVKIKIYGNNNIINIAENCYLHNVYLRIGFPDCPVNNCSIFIDKNTTINSADMQIGEDNSSINIGQDCMLSFGIEFACTDTHSIIDANGELLNFGKKIEIGSHVWICKEVKILKNTKIPDNCIVAQNSIVTKRFDENNSIFAGNPAKIVKRNINWLRERPNNYLKNLKG